MSRFEFVRRPRGLSFIEMSQEILQSRLKFHSLFAISLLGVALLVSPPVEATDLTLTITTPSAPPPPTGALTISVPANFDLGSSTAGSTISPTMGAVTVTDTRGTSAGWTVGVIASALTNTTVGNTIIPTAMSYSSGVITPSGTVTMVEQDQTNLTGVVPIATASLGSGNFGATWTPTLQIVIAVGSADGVYTGTITHSVA